MKFECLSEKDDKDAYLGIGHQPCDDLEDTKTMEMLNRSVVARGWVGIRQMVKYF